jgi:cell fate regulator YaaT (PSP1 superfamily)
MEIKKVKVFLDRQNKWFECDVRSFNPAKNARVVCETPRGLECGKVVGDIQTSEPNEQLIAMVRFETEKDRETAKQNVKKELKFKNITKKLVKQFNLEMKIVDVLLSLDGSKVTISFTAEDRVDFRELVKELASALKTRIELRQIGARDEVKMIGALGPCGKECCCAGSFNEFCHVSIKMAKVQNLSRNPSHISGMCGRLMCCLSYENAYYAETLAKMPKVGSVVGTPDGNGVVVFNNILKQVVSVRFDNDQASEIRDFELDKLVFEKPKNQESVVND